MENRPVRIREEGPAVLSSLSALIQKTSTSKTSIKNRKRRLRYTHSVSTREAIYHKSLLYHELAAVASASP